MSMISFFVVNNQYNCLITYFSGVGGNLTDWLLVQRLDSPHFFTLPPNILNVFIDSLRVEHSGGKKLGV